MEKTKRTRKFGVDTVGFIRQALSGYIGGNAIAGEMLQNADDAKASWLSFRFHPEALVVRNSSLFTEQDFDNITLIASGGKRNEEEKIGTWGTGFLSVYHLTDKPELFSSGIHLIFDPTQSEIPEEDIPFKNYTEFHLSWRKEETDVSQKLNAEIWGNEDITGLRNYLGAAIYPLIIFLRNVYQIEVFENTEGIYSISNRKKKWEILNGSDEAYYQFLYSHWGIKRQEWILDYNNDTNIWLSYHGSTFYNRQDFKGLTIKDRTVSIAFPVKQAESSKSNFPGLLYNFLPIQTQEGFLQTGLPFQINGAFFPNNNRDSILINKNPQSKESLWNETVINALGELFVHSIIDIREQIMKVSDSPDNFYKILPFSCPERDFLKPIYKSFVDSAQNYEIVHNSLGEWKLPNQVLVSNSKNLYDLSYQYLSIFPDGDCPQFKDFLYRILKCEQLQIGHILRHLRGFLKNGQPLHQAYGMINSRDKLQRLYNEMQSLHKDMLLALPLCLAEDETLCLSRDIWRVPKETRTLFSDTGICFLDESFQEEFSSLFNNWVEEFKGNHLVNWLQEQHLPAARLDTLPPILKDFNYLRSLLHFLADDIKNIGDYRLRNLPIIRLQGDQLTCAKYEEVYFDNHAYENNTLQLIGFAFVYRSWWARDNKIQQVYSKAGVKILNPTDVIQALERISLDTLGFSREELTAHLLNLYKYFNSQKLNPSTIRRLHSLKICLTQKGQLVSKDSHNIYFAPTSQDIISSEVTHCLGKLELDYIIHEDLLTNDGRNFLRETLGITELSIEDFICNVIVPHYSHHQLNDEARLQLLKYISNQMYRFSQIPNFDKSKIQQLWKILQDAKLVRCNDGKYYTGNQVYFTSTVLDRIFINGYPKLHQCYAVPVATDSNIDEAPYRKNEWYWFFNNIHVNEHPNPVDIVAAIRRVTQGQPPDQKALDSIRPIYEFLNEMVMPNGRYAINDSTLQQLQQIAWLPARQDKKRWFKPHELYLPRVAVLIGDEGYILELPEPGNNLCTLLGLQKFPPTALVITRLRKLARNNNPTPNEIYRYLGENSSAYELEGLKKEKIIWDKQRSLYWSPNQVFINDYHHFFGTRRGYLKPTQSTKKFFTLIGVKEKVDLWGDYINLIKEIAGDYRTGDKISSNDLDLLLNKAFFELGKQERSAQELQGIAFIPGEDGVLHTSNHIIINDLPEILEKFSEHNISVISDNMLPSLQAKTFLKRLGVNSLSRATHRKMVNVEKLEEDEALRNYIQERIPLFQRIQITLRHHRDDFSSNELLQIPNLKVYTCTSFSTQYILKLGQSELIGSIDTNVEALYQRHNSTNDLYVKKSALKNNSWGMIAQELDNVLFPNEKQVLAIRSLLSEEIDDAHKLLDQYGYQRLPASQEQFWGEGEAESLNDNVDVEAEDEALREEMDDFVNNELHLPSPAIEGDMIEPYQEAFNQEQGQENEKPSRHNKLSKQHEEERSIHILKKTAIERTSPLNGDNNEVFLPQGQVPSDEIKSQQSSQYDSELFSEDVASEREEEVERHYPKQKFVKAHFVGNIASQHEHKREYVTLSEETFEAAIPSQIKDYIEFVSMKIVIDFEERNGATVEDVSGSPQYGFDLLSTYPDGQQRKIEVKGRANVGAIPITCHEWRTARDYGIEYWLYVVYNCTTNGGDLPICIQDPYTNLPIKRLVVDYENVTAFL